MGANPPPLPGAGGFIDYSSEHGTVYTVDSLPICVRELIAGGAAGAFSRTLVAPLERIKILFQIRSEGFRSIGLLQSFKKIVQNEGIYGLYKGNAASVIRIVPHAALHYMTYEQYRCLIVSECPSLGTGPSIDFLAGSAAEGTAVICTYPLDLARTKLAYQVRAQKNSWHHAIRWLYGEPPFQTLFGVFKELYREGGVRAFYRGFGPTFVGILPCTGLKYYVYEKLKRQVPEVQKDSIALRLSCGALAGLVGQTFTYPLDVVRRQMQVENMVHGKSQYNSSVEGLTSIIRHQGWRQLYAGLSINYIRVVPSVAFGFTAYDVIKSRLHFSSEG
ncbi:hypothetical protein SAY86_004673 [Trapa natans]|uniref:Mitochondrial carrier protein n=1 Tax=Trapa natans TaxID=22666 RepID=A0AAN7RP12_TRANT|nr:hypothetical protein SAY86_004673 [Trapa natans]